MKRVSALIVDTNETVLFLYKNLIESHSPQFDRFFVDNINKAKKLIELKKFDILAINYKLSVSEKETGISIAVKFREQNRNAPIIILTSLVGDAKKEAKKFGLTNKVLFLRKPITFSNLSDQLKDFLGVAPW